ncbi:MAG: hypothetical protein A2287_10550 [Candidatus Melainabacteria bacterium RIFOXYA12_FULL_32_12]|nr:MAG: hypothetical protein A2287_10550 [Candidatus Melainabacteria bacterium RIFOXYA12_FULL_32_12]
MNRFSIIALNLNENLTDIDIKNTESEIVSFKLLDEDNKFKYGLGNFINQLIDFGISFKGIGIELCIVALLVTAGDKISRKEHSQDSWTREIDLYIPVFNIEKWTRNKQLLEKTLNFLSGDIWRLFFRPTENCYRSLFSPIQQRLTQDIDCVCLFSGGMDSFIGATDLLSSGRKPLLVSHYWDTLTPSYQRNCISSLNDEYGDSCIKQAKAHMGFKNDFFPQAEPENTLRARSFLFFSLAVLASTGLNNSSEIFIPENGLISINVPLTQLRLASLSTRTTHPFYMARVQELLDNLEIDSVLINPYKFKTKGEMAQECINQKFLKKNLKYTISCSSPGKGRYAGESQEHCGHCMPCIIRQSSIKHAFNTDDTDYRITLPSEDLDRTKAEGKDVKAFNFAIERMENNLEDIQSLIYIPGPLYDYSFEEIDKFADVYRRGMLEVKNLLSAVRVS